MALDWPAILAPSSEGEWLPRGGSRSGGVSLEGNEQIVASPTARFRPSLTIPCNTPAKVLAMRRVLALGRTAEWLIGPCEVTRAPWFVDPLAGGKITYGKGQKDAALDPAWDANADTSSDLDFRLAGEIALNATSMTIQRIRGGLLTPGMLFSIADRLHAIVDLTTPDPGADVGYAAPGLIGISFRPWTRATYVASTSIEFGRPRGTMRLASDDTGAMELQLSRFGIVTVELVEVF